MKFFIHRLPSILLLLLGIVLVNNSYAQSLFDVKRDSVPDPSHLTGGEELWGVELTDPNVLCLDGSIPVFYVDEAVDGSDNWVFFLQGGGSCSTGPECTDKYIYSKERNEMSTHWASKSISGGGILNPDSTINEFANYNRVKIKKCSFDRWMGNKTLTVNTIINGVEIKNYVVNFHGREIVKAVLNQLASGIPYHDNSCDVGVKCRILPPLSDADIVLMTGSSGGGVGLSHAADDLASEIRTIRASCATPPCTETTIRTVIDAAFMPGPEHEYRYSAANPGGIMNFTSVATTLLETATYDLQVYSAPSGRLYEQQEAWRDDRDNSCEVQHGPNHPLCEDHLHILRYHLETPVFLSQDLEDGNSAHTNNGNGWTPNWAVSAAFPAGPEDYKSRVISQANMFTGLQIGGFPVRIFAPTCQRHVGLTNDNAFFNHRLDNLSSGVQRTFHDALINWVTNPISSAVIGVDDGIKYSSSC